MNSDILKKIFLNFIEHDISSVPRKMLEINSKNVSEIDSKKKIEATLVSTPQIKIENENEFLKYEFEKFSKYLCKEEEKRFCIYLESIAKKKRYLNIKEIKEIYDDCIIICNRDVKEKLFNEFNLNLYFEIYPIEYDDILIIKNKKNIGKLFLDKFTNFCERTDYELIEQVCLYREIIIFKVYSEVVHYKHGFSNRFEFINYENTARM